MEFVDGSISGDIPINELRSTFNITNFVVSQANIFVVPFLKFSHLYRHQSRYLLYKVWEGLCRLIFAEAKLRLEQLDHIGVLPARVQSFYRFVCQGFTGDVNIVPRLKFKDLLNLMCLPSSELVEDWTLRGSNVMFFHLEHVKNIRRIEFMLEEINVWMENGGQNRAMNGQ